MIVTTRSCSPIRWMNYASAFTFTVNIDDVPMRGSIFVDKSDIDGSIRTSIDRLFNQYWISPGLNLKVTLGSPPCNPADVEQIVTHIKNHLS